MDTRGPSGELVSVARRLYYSRPPESAGGLPQRRLGDTVSGGTDGIAATLAETARVLNQKLPGLVNGRTHLFTSVEELLDSDYGRNRGFTPEDIVGLRTAEGFYDPVKGRSVVVGGNVVPRAGESPQQALTRVVLHEGVSHAGLNTLLGQEDSPRHRR